MEGRAAGIGSMDVSASDGSQTEREAASITGNTVARAEQAEVLGAKDQLPDRAAVGEPPHELERRQEACWRSPRHIGGGVLAIIGLVMCVLVLSSAGDEAERPARRIEVRNFSWNVTVANETAHYSAALTWHLVAPADGASDRTFAIPLGDTTLVRSVELVWAGKRFTSDTIPKGVATGVQRTSRRVEVPSATVHKPDTDRSSVSLDVSMPKNGTLIVTVTLDDRAALKDGWHTIPVHACDAAGVTWDYDQSLVTTAFTAPKSRATRLRVVSSLDGVERVPPREWTVFNAELGDVATERWRDGSQWYISEPMEGEGAVAPSRILSAQNSAARDGASVWQRSCDWYGSSDAPVPHGMLFDYSEDVEEDSDDGGVALVDLEWEVDQRSGFFLHRFELPRSTLILPPVRKSVVIALDVSGAMAFGRLWSTAQFAVRRVLAQLQEEDRFTILPFTWGAEPTDSFFPELATVSVESINAASMKLRTVRLGSTANVKHAVETSLAILRSTTDVDQPSVIVVTADGNPVHSPSDLDVMVHGVKCDVSVLEIYDARMGGRNTKQLAELAAAGGGVFMTVNATQMTAQCPQAAAEAEVTPCEDVDFEAVLGERGELFSLDAVIGHKRPSLLDAHLTYSFPTATQVIVITDQLQRRQTRPQRPGISVDAVRAQSELLVVGRMLLPGEHAWWLPTAPPPAPIPWGELTEQQQFARLKSEHAGELGPMTLHDFRQCDPRDLENFLGQHIPLHMTAKVRALLAAQASSYAEVATPPAPPPGVRLAVPENATHPPPHPELRFSGRGRGGLVFNLTQPILAQHQVEAMPWRSGRLGPVVFGSGARVEVLSPPRTLRAANRTMQGLELAMAAMVVSDWSSMSVAALPANLANDGAGAESPAAMGSESSARAPPRIGSSARARPVYTLSVLVAMALWRSAYMI